MEFTSDIQIITNCMNVVSSYSYQSTRHLEMCFETLLYMVLLRTTKHLLKTCISEIKQVIKEEVVHL